MIKKKTAKKSSKKSPEVIKPKEKAKKVKKIRKKIKLKSSSPTKLSKFRTNDEIAMDFATKVHKKFNHLVKATILFGSQAKGEAKSGSDIDIVIIIDDAAINWDAELTAWYREELGKLMANQKYSRELHINTIRVTTWWNDLFRGDAVMLNILRNGRALIDLAGFFNPIKALLMQGRIHSTPEAVYNSLQRAPKHLARSKFAKLGAIEGIYWAMIDSAQAALITIGKLPPSPEHVATMLKEEFVNRDLLKSEYVKWYKDVYTLHKAISHGEIRHVKGSLIDDWQEKAEKFMRKMVQLIDRLLESNEER